MPKQYDNNMSGALFRNKKKEKGDNKPDLTGKCEINGEEIYISAWSKENDKVGKFLSLSFTYPEDSKGAKSTKKQSRREEPEDDDDIPF